MGRMTRWMDERLYRDYRDNWDDWLFRDRILAELTPESVVLDLGAGAGIATRAHRDLITGALYRSRPTNRSCSQVPDDPFIGPFAGR